MPRRSRRGSAAAPDRAGVGRLPRPAAASGRGRRVVRRDAAPSALLPAGPEKPRGPRCGPRRCVQRTQGASNGSGIRPRAHRGAPAPREACGTRTLLLLRALLLRRLLLGALLLRRLLACGHGCRLLSETGNSDDGHDTRSVPNEFRRGFGSKTDAEPCRGAGSGCDHSQFDRSASDAFDAQESANLARRRAPRTGRRDAAAHAARALRCDARDDAEPRARVLIKVRTRAPRNEATFSN